MKNVLIAISILALIYASVQLFKTHPWGSFALLGVGGYIIYLIIFNKNIFK